MCYLITILRPRNEHSGTFIPNQKIDIMLHNIITLYMYIVPVRIPRDTTTMTDQVMLAHKWKDILLKMSKYIVLICSAHSKSIKPNMPQKKTKKTITLSTLLCVTSARCRRQECWRSFYCSSEPTTSIATFEFNCYYQPYLIPFSIIKYVQAQQNYLLCII